MIHGELTQPKIASEPTHSNAWWLKRSKKVLNQRKKMGLRNQNWYVITYKTSGFDKHVLPFFICPGDLMHAIVACTEHLHWSPSILHTNFAK